MARKKEHLYGNSILNIFNNILVKKSYELKTLMLPERLNAKI